jgi:beta-lactamase regulating signal transducer with metallopeptidase domain
MTMVEQLNAIARLWWAWSAAMLWQVGLLIILIGCIDLLIRRWAWPQLRYALWSLILVKLLLPPTLSLPSGIVPELRPVISQAIHLMNPDKPSAAENTGAIADFGLQIADLNRTMGAQSEIISLQSAGLGISDDESEISDSVLAATPHSALRTPQFTWQFHAMLIWFAGTLILGIWLFLRLHSFYGRRAYQAAAASLPPSFYNQMADCANRLGLRHVPRVVVTKRLASPAVFGALRPVLLMPKGYLSKLSRRDTEHMLLHELAHVKRGDLAMHSLYMLLQISYWYNPLLWLVRRQMHHLRELSCDATVANLLRERTLAYRQTLLETARRLLAASVEPGLGLLGLFEDSNRLLVRLNWLTKPTWRYRTMKRTVVVAVAALMIACVLPMARAQESVSNEVKDVRQRERVSVNTEERDPQSRDQMSPDLRSLQKHLDQMMAQQKELQNQLQALAERRHAASSDQEPGDQLSPDLNSLQKHLDELTTQQRDLQRQLRALADERRSLAEGRREKQRDPAPGRAGGGRPGGREAPEIREEVGRERGEREEALREAKQAVAEVREAQAQAQRKYVDQMKGWGAEMKQWEQSEPMQQWRRDIENWQKQVQEWAQDLAKRQMSAASDSADAAKPAPMPEMPKMPPMPKMPAPVRKEMRLEIRKGMEPRYEAARVDLGDVDSVDMPSVNVPPVELPVMAPPVPPVPPVAPMPPGIPEKQENQEEAVSRVEQVIDLAPGQLLNLKTEMGSITVRGGGEGDVVLKTNMGSIRIHSQASDEPGRAERNRLEPGSGPRPEPRREPRPEGEF